jgi:putative DNA primase/helicase
MAIKTSDIIPAPDFEVIPDELKQHSHWLLWQARPKKDKPGEGTKIPVTIEGTAFNGWNDPNNLYSFEEVEEAFQSGKFTGVGFALAGTDFICIDLDNNVSPDHISEELLKLIPYGYTEISPSGKGYHIWLKGRKPEGMGQNGYTATGEKLEVLSGGRWVTMTGNAVFPTSIIEDQPLIDELYKCYFKEKQSEKKNTKPTLTSMTRQDLETIKEKMFDGRYGQKICALWKGDTSEYGGDHSRADFALCRHLAFYAKGDYSNLDALFRQSGLFRPKWDRRLGDTTYGGRTIAKAIDLLRNREGYQVDTHATPMQFDVDQFATTP